MADKKLTPKQDLFVQEYLIDLNATQAAIRAGYSKHTAQEQSSRLLSNVIISQAVKEANAQRLENTGINAQWVLDQSVDLYKECREKGELTAAKACMDLVGKHVDIAAFAERKILGVDDPLAEWLGKLPTK